MLFEAILDYAEHGIEPDFDGVVGVAWDFIKPGIDRDSDRYGNQVLQKQYAAYVREAKKKGQTPLSFDDWKSIPDSERYRAISGDTERYPTTATTPTTTTATTATIESKADRPPKPLRHKYGEYKNVLLSDDEFAKLQAEIPCWQEMIERLSSYMESSGKKYKSHLATMRNWYRNEQSTAKGKNPMPDYGGDGNWSL